ncbi:hypothetical protein N658DRAFT_490275 [Parathielavia hyrcaniae]|uniref:Nephrocystin 3-like N-terminal domain-containing protein n=1 Tax=Parathielavia hyrcaniae TaxID=113614 RepID=A0AAN6PS40_9PEZI|nr:hypothetical protein N658DRAFT_490275 [Parathielavia hyrcaniae]
MTSILKLQSIKSLCRARTVDAVVGVAVDESLDIHGPAKYCNAIVARGIENCPTSPSRTPTADGTNGRDQAGFEGQRLKEVYWPADLACQTIPNSRILTYGYDAKVWHWLKGQALGVQVNQRIVDTLMPNFELLTELREEFPAICQERNWLTRNTSISHGRPGKDLPLVLSKPEYTSWRNFANQPDNGGFLWIRGNPGTGKSTLMKFLFEDAKSETKRDASQTVLSFFFLARGELEEKSTPGLHRSLLHQLFQMVPDLQDSLEWMTADGARGIRTNGWNEEALKQTFCHAINKLGTQESQVRLTAQTLQAEILEKSSLIFLWVVLVVDILNSEYPGKPIGKMRQHLEEIPPKLADLFEMILNRDEEDPKLLQVCLQWILFATRPLKSQELYFAVQFGVKEAPCSGQWDQEIVDLDEMKAFVRHSSKGLAGVTRSKTSEVQFIHESVREFLLGKYGAGQRFGVILSGNFEGQSHKVLRDCCLAQLETDMLRADLRLRFPLLEYSLLNILQHADSAQQHGSCFDVVPDARYGPPIFAALATGSTEAVRGLLEAEVQAQPVESQCRLREHSSYSRRGRGCSVTLQSTATNSSMSMRRDNNNQTPLSWAAERGHEAVVKLLGSVK